MTERRDTFLTVLVSFAWRGGLTLAGAGSAFVRLPALRAYLRFALTCASRLFLQSLVSSFRMVVVQTPHWAAQYQRIQASLEQNWQEYQNEYHDDANTSGSGSRTGKTRPRGRGRGKNHDELYFQ
jgi:hypothetical protein